MVPAWERFEVSDAFESGWFWRAGNFARHDLAELLAAFDEPLPAVGEPTDDNPVPVGFWAMSHFLMKPQGYDWYQEVDACSKSIQNRLVSLATFTSDQEARQTLDDVIGDLGELREQFED